MESLIDAVLLGFLVLIAFTIIRVRNLFAAVMLTGIYSLLSALLFVLLDAVDVAFTEAAVGAGVSTVLMLGTLALVGDSNDRPRHSRALPLAVVIITGAALIYATGDMPQYGRPDTPAQTHVAPEYLTRAQADTQVPNVVTAVLASYRGFDTLGEVAVVFTAAVGVILLLKGGGGSGGSRP